MNEQSSAIPEALEKVDSTAIPQALEKVDLANLNTSVDRFVNREFSWLQFNRRVLEEAENTHQPLLERLRFLSISAANLDEFFMVRVAGLKAQQLLGVEEMSPDGLNPAQQIAAITIEVDHLTASQEQVWSTLSGQLRQAGVELLHEARDPHLEELVEVLAEDGEELGPLEQRQVRVLGQGEHAVVEVEPRELAVQEPVGRIRQWRLTLRECDVRPGHRTMVLPVRGLPTGPIQAGARGNVRGGHEH